MINPFIQAIWALWFTFVPLPRRSSAKQLLHWCRWFSPPHAGQWNGGRSADRATFAGWHSEPHRGKEERHPSYWQWAQPGGVAAAQRASEGADHRLRAQAEGEWAHAICLWFRLRTCVMFTQCSRVKKTSFGSINSSFSVAFPSAVSMPVLSAWQAAMNYSLCKTPWVHCFKELLLTTWEAHCMPEMLVVVVYKYF